MQHGGSHRVTACGSGVEGGKTLQQGVLSAHHHAKGWSHHCNQSRDTHNPPDAPAFGERDSNLSAGVPVQLVLTQQLLSAVKGLVQLVCSTAISSAFNDWAQCSVQPKEEIQACLVASQPICVLECAPDSVSSF